MEKVISYIKQNQQRYQDELFELLRIPSISADSKYKDDVLRCADKVAEHLKKAGLEKVEVLETGGYPAVYGEWLKAPGRPTVMIYGHYDVQPVDPLDKWVTKPFEPTVKNGNVYARGAADDKGQFFTHVKAVEAYLKNGNLPLNIKFFIEGEEEGGTGGTPAFVHKNPEKLKCDAVLISDSNWFDKDVPSICYSLRGMCYMEVTVKGPNRDLHSGSYGGTVMNPLNAMGMIISKLQDENGRVMIDGFYDDVLEVTKTERAEYKKLPFNEEDYRKDLGVNALWGEKGYTTLERNWCRPSLDIHGIYGGYMGEGPKTVITSEGTFKISSRLVFNQDPKKILECYKKYITKIAPPGTTVEVKLLHDCKPVLFPLDNPFIKAAGNAYEKGFGKRPIFVREGASIPITIDFQEALKVPSVLSGIGLPDDNIHSPNEKLSLSNFQNGIITHAYMLEELAKAK